MKKFVYLIILMICLTGCLSNSKIVAAGETKKNLDYLLSQNEKYINATKNNADISLTLRKKNAENGQNPYAIIITCSDSRVVPEHIFMAGIGELFVIRTAGNVVSDFEIGSAEYAAEHLGASTILVLGHERCGAIEAAISGHATGYIATITNEISAALKGERNPRTAEKINVQNSLNDLAKSAILTHLHAEGKIKVHGAIANIDSGKVEVIDSKFK